MLKYYKAYSLVNWIAASAAILAIAAVLVASAKPAQQIVIVAKDMMFTVEGSPNNGAENPLLWFSAGTTVTIIFRNEDVGMRHDLVIEGLAVRSRVLEYGSEQRLVVTVPRTKGEYVYLCSLHPRMMRGLLMVYDDTGGEDIQ